MTGSTHHVLIPDFDQARDCVTRLLDDGFCPMPAGSYPLGKPDARGKGWISQWNRVALNQASAPRSAVLDAFRAHPGIGISLAAPALNHPRRSLLALDIDIQDPEILRRVASIFADCPLPIRQGAKGWGVFVTFETKFDLPALLKERELSNHAIDAEDATGVRVSTKWASATEIRSAEHDGAKIELIGYKVGHVLIPPTLHLVAGKPYEWLPSPVTNETAVLPGVHPSALPLASCARIMLLLLSVKPGTKAIWDYMGNTDEGDHHDKMRSATFQMYHEGLTKEEIIEVAIVEARRSADTDAKFQERSEAIHAAVNGLEAKVVVRSPAPVRRNRNGPRVPIERQHADWLMTNFGLENLGMFNGVPHVWFEGHWESMVRMSDPEPLSRVHSLLLRQFPEATHASSKGAIKTFFSAVERRLACDDQYLIPFANGVLDVRTMALRQETREDCIVGFIPHPYDPVATCPKWENFINDLLLPSDMHRMPNQDAQYDMDHRLAVDLVEEFLGYSLVRSYQFRHILLLIGETSTGKSVLTKVLRGLMPKGWLSEVALEKFSEPNSVRRMVNAHLNVSSETGRAHFAKSVDEQILRITSSEAVEVKTLYEDTIEVELPARLLVNGNMPPEFNDSTGAMERRMLFISTTDIQPKPIVEYEKILLEEASGILNRLVRAYGRLQLRTPKGFILPSYSKKEAKQATEDSNSVSAWVHRACEIVDVKEGSPGEQLYPEYNEWCQMHGMKAFSVTGWEKIMKGMKLGPRSVRMGAQFARLRPIRLLEAGKRAF